LSRHLKTEENEVCTAGSIEDANNIIQLKSVAYAIVDLKIDYKSDFGGVKLIENINKLQPNTKIIVLSAYEKNVETQKQLEQVVINGFVTKGGERNYILAVIDELNKLREDHPPKKCFVIMPFSKTRSCDENQWRDIFDNTIKPAVEELGLNYVCTRANLVIGNIIKDILDNLNKADVVIADMTDRNPNVFYELGVRHALRNTTVLITQNIDDIPFDLQHYAALQYDWKTKNGKKEFREKIRTVFAEIEKDPTDKNVMSPVWEYLKLNS
jgi:ActR/RegA family two-component response regulator